MARTDWLVVAVSGATCSGKTTLAKKLHAAYPGAVLLHQDDYFLPVDDPRHTTVPTLNHINFEILSSLDNDVLLDKILLILDGPGGFLFLDGFLILNDSRIADLCDLKFYLTLDKDTCWARRSVRVYEPPDPPGYYELCVWPSYLQNLKYVQENVADVVYLSGSETVSDLCRSAVDTLNAKIKKKPD